MANVYVSGVAAIAADGLANRQTQPGNFNRVPQATFIAHNYAFISYWLWTKHTAVGSDVVPVDTIWLVWNLV